MTVSPSADASRRSSEIRCARGELRRCIAALSPVAGRRLAAETIENPTSELRGMRVRSVVGAVAYIGPSRARLYLETAGMDPWHETLGEMTVRERIALAELLRRPMRLHPSTAKRAS